MGATECEGRRRREGEGGKRTTGREGRKRRDNQPSIHPPPTASIAITPAKTCASGEGGVDSDEACEVWEEVEEGAALEAERVSTRVALRGGGRVSRDWGLRGELEEQGREEGQKVS